ncbi:MAG TPA: hypothetical protein VGN57_18500 [Pirellulaceae bacterium]|jgi:hypothetical protein|nr:hypothetical protein [Pirellulaceae bacterium]
MSDLHPESPHRSAARVEVPAEVRRTSDGRILATGCLLSAAFVAFPALVYFGSFGLLVLDELILETRYLSQGKLGQQAVDVSQFIYAPLFYLMHVAFGVD